MEALSRGISLQNVPLHPHLSYHFDVLSKNSGIKIHSLQYSQREEKLYEMWEEC